MIDKYSKKAGMMMFIAQGWTDYQLIDASSRERLERWGEYKLIRPEPQVIWDTNKDARWDNPDGVYKRAARGNSSWVVKNTPEEWVINCGEMRFLISLMGSKQTGIFPEQKANWDWFTPIIEKAVIEGRTPKVLNAFAYTGGASIAAAKAGASVCHVDSAKSIIARAKRNAELSNIPQDRIRYITDDCMKFIAREIRRGNSYDAIIMDPPSFGRGASGELWKMEDMADKLISMAAKLMSNTPLFFLLNSYTTGLSPALAAYIMNLRIAKSLGGVVDYGELGLKVESTGLVLPCGTATRISF